MINVNLLKLSVAPKHCKQKCVAKQPNKFECPECTQTKINLTSEPWLLHEGMMQSASVFNAFHYVSAFYSVLGIGYINNRKVTLQLWTYGINLLGNIVYVLVWRLNTLYFLNAYFYLFHFFLFFRMFSNKLNILKMFGVIVRFLTLRGNKGSFFKISFTNFLCPNSYIDWG